jgi:hypothetical protein
MERRGRGLLPLIGLLLVAAGTGVGLVYLVRRLVPVSALAAHNDALGGYLQTLGTIYAVLLAFVVFVVWSQYNDVHATVEREANEIADLIRIAGGLPAAVCDGVRDELRRYVEAVVGEEWRTMARGESSGRAAALLDQLWRELQALEPATAREQALYAEALARFNDLSDHRTHRLLGSRTRVPATMWLLLGVGAVLTLGSMALFGVRAFWSHALMTSSLAILICFVLYVIYDLDNPFWGDWQVSAEPLLGAVATASGDRERRP